MSWKRLYLCALCAIVVAGLAQSPALAQGKGKGGKGSSAGWRYRERVRFEYGRQIVYTERYWQPAVLVTSPTPILVTPLEPMDVEWTMPIFSTGYYVYRPYRIYSSGPYRSYRVYRR